MRHALALLLALAASSSLADEAPQPSGKVKYEHVAVPVPSVAVEGKTDGSADLSLSAGLQLGLSPGWDATPRLTFKASSSDGVGTLFSWTSSKGDKTPPPWSLGASVVLSQFAAHTRDVTLDEVKAPAYSACKAACLGKPAPTGCDTFKKKKDEELADARRLWAGAAALTMEPAQFCTAQRQAAADVWKDERANRITPDAAAQSRVALLTKCLDGCDDPSSTDRYCRNALSLGYPVDADTITFMRKDFCSAGQELWDQHQKEPAQLERLSKYPTLTVKVGARVGRSQFKDLEQDSSAPTGQLKVNKTTRAPITAGASFAKIVGGGHSHTFEGLVVYDRSFQASTTSARWCVPAGTVSGSPAESCTDLPLGAPADQGTLRLAVYGGYLDQAANVWRVAGGVDAVLHRGGGSEVSIAAPVWVSFAGTQGKYLGVARFTPSFTWITDKDGKTTQQALLSVALLGQPTLFSPDFDRL